MRSKLLTLATVLSLSLFLATAALWHRAHTKTDVLMVALPGGKCLLVKSHEGRWFEVSGVSGWPDRGLHAWSAGNQGPMPFSRRRGFRWNSWERAGPFLFWQRHAVASHGLVQFIHGT